jgi:murein DD-endopeptidase
MQPLPWARWLLLAWACAFASACATPAAQRSASPARHTTPPRTASLAKPASVAATALDMVGAPYKWGGSSPEGFDCSGLVLYSYEAVGVEGLPHSARRLQQVATPMRVSEVEPGDLLFFRLSGKKAAHVGIYVGQRHFVHAPSRGKHVEKVSFDHVYWGRQLQQASAGRIRR